MSKGNMRRLEKKKKKKKEEEEEEKRQTYMTKTTTTTPFVEDFGCNRQIWTSFNDCDDIGDPK